MNQNSGSFSGTDLFFAGTSGLVLPVPNKLSFPEVFRNRSRLSYYAHLYNSIEVNSSFYKVPMQKTVARWAGETPENFRFTFKLYKGITHNPGISFDKNELNHFLEVISGAGIKKGCLLIQFPAGTRFQLRALKSLLTSISRNPHHHGWKLCVEFRHISWYCQQIYDLLRKFNCTLVGHDIPASATPGLPLWSGTTYLRFHGPTGNYRGSYSNDFLEITGRKIAQLLQNKQRVYAYFNNTLGEPTKNLITLVSEVHGSIHS